MLILCYGMPKSGSTLAFELVKGTLNSAGFRQETFVNHARGLEDQDRNLPGLRNFVKNLDREVIQSVLDEIGPDRRIAVKTHSHFPEADFAWIEQQQQNGKLRIIASYRDPREMCLSLMDAAEKARERGLEAFGGIELMRRAQRNVRNRIVDFRRWAAIKGALRLSYDTVAFLPDEAIGQIEDYLQIKSDREAVKYYAFAEAPTQKNKAKRDRYKELSEAQNKEMLRRFGEYIRRVCEQDEQSWFDECRTAMLKMNASESA